MFLSSSYKFGFPRAVAGNVSSAVRGSKLGLFRKKSPLKINFAAHLLTFARSPIPLVVAEDWRRDIFRPTYQASDCRLPPMFSSLLNVKI